ncbi:MAG: hypothetical protein H8E34_01915 [Bacteroidetes bacterium]|nr:hypothetical protein [Bacteroidota bacterium]MBL6944909.1 hypothetical protein [Bacteroidales bacterium]
MTIVSSNLNWGKNNWVGIIEADGKGYYAYLPAIFIYNDLNFGFFKEIEEEKYYNENLYYDYRSGAYGKVINKYYCGTAIAELPFFLIAHLTANLWDIDADGYSKIYPVLISIAALFYLLIGLLYLDSTLIIYNKSEWQKSLTLITAVFGTNLFYYTVGEPGMSHVYSFAFISMFFYYSKQYFASFRKKYLIILAIILGLIVLIRPINGLIVFILPFAAGNLSNLKKGITIAVHYKWRLIYSLGSFIAIVGIQFIIYKVSTGHFFIDSYGEEGFNFRSPHFIDILFSYKKGLFLYTPLFLLSLTGGYFLWKNSRFEFYSLFGFLILITYVFSSWWMWYYGGSFSSRVYVEYIPLFMILLAISLNGIKSKVTKRFYVGVVILLIVVCQIQTYQYRYYHIHWSDMNKEKYWDVFMRIDKL